MVVDNEKPGREHGVIVSCDDNFLEDIATEVYRDGQGFFIFHHSLLDDLTVGPPFC